MRSLRSTWVVTVLIGGVLGACNWDYPALVAELGLRAPNDAPLPFDPTQALYYDRIAEQLQLPMQKALAAPLDLPRRVRFDCNQQGSP
jgi:hypothetical protein